MVYSAVGLLFASHDGAPVCITPLICADIDWLSAGTPMFVMPR